MTPVVPAVELPVPVDAAWAEALVRGAEATYNARDLAAIMRCYHPAATLEIISDGVRDEVHGLAEIERAWRTAFAVFPELRVRKQLVAAGGDGAIVNEWTGSIDGRSAASGLDLWWVDPASRTVVRHRVIAFNRVVDADSFAGRMRWLMLHPTTLVRMARARR